MLSKIRNFIYNKINLWEMVIRMHKLNNYVIEIFNLLSYLLLEGEVEGP